MRLNGKKVLEIMGSKNLSAEIVCVKTGLSEKALSWILENGFASEDAMERIADAIGTEVRRILLPDVTSNEENAIEFLKGSSRATVTFSQGRYITKIKKLAAERPEECEILAQNNDGGILAHIPVSRVKISPLKEVSEERREQAREQMLAYRAKRGMEPCRNR